jgi:CDP-diacylglycerol--serine O-phosphatidyltransferase
VKFGIRRSRRSSAANRGLLPALFTLGNAGCGFLAIAKVADALAVGDASPELFLRRIVAAAWLILLAMVFDVLDGRIARAQGTSSPFGAMLDSLVDGVSFGVAPAILVKVIAEREGHVPPKLATAAAFLYFVSALLRLARFTVREKQGHEDHGVFQGLPSPGAAGVAASSVLLFAHFRQASIPRPLLPVSAPSFVDWLMTHGVVPDVAIGAGYLRILLAIVPLLGLLMVSNVPYAHAGRLLVWPRSLRRGVEWIAVLFLLGLYPELTLATFFAAYAAGGLIRHVLERLGLAHASGRGDEGHPVALRRPAGGRVHGR